MKEEEMKFVSWNIRHGGSKNKVMAICDQLKLWSPDVVGLSEFRDSKTSQTIAASLSDMGLVHQQTTKDAARCGVNFLMLASRWPIDPQLSPGPMADTGRWLHVKIQGIHIMLMHVFNRSDEKWQFHDDVIARFTELQATTAIGFGDTNTGQPGMDEESSFFNKKEAMWFQRIKTAGWIDVWRQQNPERREFTWYSNHGNGFRLDQVFATNHFAERISNVQYDWGEGGREAKLSDHAAIVFDINCDDLDH